VFTRVSPAVWPAPVAILGLALCLSCGLAEDLDSGASSSSSQRPNVLLITVDTVRADHLGIYGYSRSTSPQMDQLGEQGVLFEVAYAPTGATSPAHATLFTSRSPMAHGLVRNGFSLASEELSLAEILKGAGYQTAGFVSSYPLKARFGFDQGFDSYDDHFEIAESTFVQRHWEGRVVEGGFDRRGAHTLKAALAWMVAPPVTAPVFLWVYFFDPHAPYAPPDGYASLFSKPKQNKRQRDIADYDSEIRYLDSLVGSLLEAFDRFSSSRPALVILTGDHGEGLYDHGFRTHNRYLYEEELRIPLILRWKDRIPSGVRVKQAVHMMDVAPTLLALLELDHEDADLDGIDLSSHWETGPAQTAGKGEERVLWFQRPYYLGGRARFEEAGYGFGLRVGNWKFVEAAQESRRELFDLSSDPDERRNLVEEHPEQVAQFSERITRWKQREMAKRMGGQREPDSNDRAALRALGYTEE
jgi:arylsulfatase A-like enzyme